MIRPSVLALLAFALLSPVGSASAASKNEGDATNVVYDPSLYQALRIPPHRTLSRRTGHCGHRSPQTSVHILHGCDGRWCVGNPRCRRDVGKHLGRVPPVQGAISPSEMESTNPPTPGKLGRTWVFARHDISGEFVSTRTIQTWFTWRRSVTSSDRTRSVASSGRRTGQELGESALHLRENRRRRSLDESGEPAAGLRCNVARRNPGH